MYVMVLIVGKTEAGFEWHVFFYVKTLDEMVQICEEHSEILHPHQHLGLVNEEDMIEEMRQKYNPDNLCNPLIKLK